MELFRESSEMIPFVLNMLYVAYMCNLDRDKYHRDKQDEKKSCANAR